MIATIFRTGLAAVLLSTALSSCFADIMYNITDLGVLANAPSNGGSYPTAMNNSGEVVGYGDTYTLYSHAFLYTGSGPLVNLGSLAGDYSVSAATGINDSGTVVGYTDTPGTGNPTHAFVYTQSGGMQDLGTLGGVQSEATGTNNSGQIIGWAETASESVDGFIYSGSGPMLDLGPYLPQRINNAGLVAAVLGSGSQDSTYISSAGTGAWTNIGSLGGTYTIPYGMNDSEEVVGYSATSSASEHGPPFLYSNGVMLDLGTFGGLWGTAYGVNDLGVVVGSADFAGDVSGAAFVYYGSGSIENLNDLVSPSLDWDIVGAVSINNQGQIAAEAYQPGENYHAILLTPTPEPPSLCLLLAALLTASAIRRYRSFGR